MSAFDVLTPRERQVARLLALGMSTREVSNHLGTNIKTIDTHRGRVLKKLELRNCVALARLAIRENFTSMHDEEP